MAAGRGNCFWPGRTSSPVQARRPQGQPWGPSSYPAIPRHITPKSGHSNISIGRYRRVGVSPWRRPARRCLGFRRQTDDYDDADHAAALRAKALHRWRSTALSRSAKPNPLWDQLPVLGDWRYHARARPIAIAVPPALWRSRCRARRIDEHVLPTGKGNVELFEQQAIIDQLVERLSARFPQVPQDTVTTVMRDLHPWSGNLSSSD